MSEINWYEMATVVINAVILPILAWAVAQLTAYLKSKTDNDRLDKYFKMANDAILTAVEEVMQTFVTTMKNAGTWSEEAAAEALQMAKTRAQEIMGAAAYKALSEIVADVDAWLTSKVEATTLQVKTATPIAAAISDDAWAGVGIEGDGIAPDEATGSLDSQVTEI